MSNPADDVTVARDVAVVIPVYNGLPELTECIESAVGQDIGDRRLEVVAVDDGSTDGSGELLDDYANHHPNLRVIHQENSGWPGRPRNVGLAASTSRYVFFADADDRLAPEALRRMVDYADQHGSDVVVPLFLPGEDAVPRGSLWQHAGPDADRAVLFKSLAPHKLLRRAFLDEHELRFPEGVVPLEDGLLFAQAFLLAERVSVLTDYVYYYRCPREGEGNISKRPKPPTAFIDSVTKIIDIAQQRADPATADRIVLDVYRRKALKYLHPERFTRYAAWRQRDWVTAIGELARTRIAPELESRLPLDARLRSAAAREGAVEAVKALDHQLIDGRVEAHARSGRILARLPRPSTVRELDITDDVTIAAKLTSARATRKGFAVSLALSTWPVYPRDISFELVLRDRAGQAAPVPVPLKRRRGADANLPAAVTLRGLVRVDALACGETGPWDAYVRLASARGQRSETGARLALWSNAPASPPPIPVPGGTARIEHYVTQHGNVSFRWDTSDSPMDGSRFPERRGTTQYLQETMRPVVERLRRTP